MTAHEMRTLARETVLSAGGRGFMRFADGGDALLVCDAPRRCADDAACMALVDALCAKGFAAEISGGLLLISPGDAMIMAIDAAPAEVCWDDELYSVQALAARLIKAPDLLLTAAGRRLAVQCLRLTGRPGEDVVGGLNAIRAQAAIMLRTGDRSGMRQAGAILQMWCDGRMEHEA